MEKVDKNAMNKMTFFFIKKVQISASELNRKIRIKNKKDKHRKPISKRTRHVKLKASINNFLEQNTIVVDKQKRDTVLIDQQEHGRLQNVALLIDTHNKKVDIYLSPHDVFLQ